MVLVVADKLVDWSSYAFFAAAIESFLLSIGGPLPPDFNITRFNSLSLYFFGSLTRSACKAASVKL